MDSKIKASSRIKDYMYMPTVTATKNKIIITSIAFFVAAVTVFLKNTTYLNLGLLWK